MTLITCPYCLSRSLATIEYDPFAAGDRIADVLQDFLASGRFPDDALLSARFVPGKSLSAKRERRRS